MPLTQQQYDALNGKSAAAIVEYIRKGQVEFPFILFDGRVVELTDPNKQAEVERMLHGIEIPKEQEEWNKIEQEYGISPQEDNLRRLSEYCKRWGTILPLNNHVAVAKERMNAIEEEEWEKVQFGTEAELLEYLRKYPFSVHRDEIDDIIWTRAKADYSVIDAVNRYLMNFPNGRHSDEARQIIAASETWNKVDKYNIFSVKEYLNNYPNSPFKTEATNILNSLKNEELKKMKDNPAGYDRETLLNLINYGIFKKEELCQHGLMTLKAFEILQRYQQLKEQLPDLSSSINESNGFTEGNTDVWLFGIPSTGKTCVLMGLVGSENLQYDPVKSGGRYATDLEKWMQMGMTPNRTPTVVTTIDATIKTSKGISHKINLVEMSGEEFATKLADNPDNEVSLEDMGDGAPALLNNNNRKVFYFVVDPTVSTVVFKRLVPVYSTTTDENGIEVSTLIENREEVRMVDQRLTLYKMVGLLFQQENKEIMEKVDSIHFIVTKSDTLGKNEEDRNSEAFDLLQRLYKKTVNYLVSRRNENKYGFNISTEGYPKLYTFSLGKFYPGGIYEYDSTDADKLIKAICNSTGGEKESSFLDNIKSKVN